jgi:hypothetical protein
MYISNCFSTSIYSSYEDGTGSIGCSCSWIGDTGEKPYLAVVVFFRGGDRPRSDSPRARPFDRPFTNGCSVHDESFEFERLWLWLWLCSCAWPLYSAYGERTAPCNCPFALISDKLCRWPFAFMGDDVWPFEYDEYCDGERSWPWACDVGAMGSAYVDAIDNTQAVVPLRRVLTRCMQWVSGLYRVLKRFEMVQTGVQSVETVTDTSE